KRQTRRPQHVIDDRRNSIRVTATCCAALQLVFFFAAAVARSTIAVTPARTLALKQKTIRRRRRRCNLDSLCWCVFAHCWSRTTSPVDSSRLQETTVCREDPGSLLRSVDRHPDTRVRVLE